jgi:ribose transport system permease protein
VAEQIGGRGKVLFLSGVPGTSSSDNMQRGAEETMKAEFPGINLVTQHAYFAQARGQEVMADMLQANPDVRGVISLNDMMILGAVVSLEEGGYSMGTGPKDVVIVCMSIDPVTARYIQDGTVYGSLYGSPQVSGYTAVAYALKAIRGEAVPPEGFIPYTLYTKENIDSLLPDLDRVRDYNFN